MENDKVAVAINSEFVSRSQWPNKIIQENDQLDVLSAVQGG